MKWRELGRHADALGFTPQDAVRWLSPRELARAGIKVVVSGVFADFADKRELQGSLPVEPIVVPDSTPRGRASRPRGRAPLTATATSGSTSRPTPATGSTRRTPWRACSAPTP